MPIHGDEVRATVEQVRRLLADQCPQWADLPVTPVPEELEGTDHLLFRVGGTLVARMPKIAWAVGQADSDARWLPMLASEHQRPSGRRDDVGPGQVEETAAW